VSHDTFASGQFGDWWVLANGKTPQHVPGPKYRVEIKSDEDGCVEEVLFHDSERMLVHLERESRDAWWLGIYPEANPVDDFESDACFDIYRSRKRIEVEKR
jgi:hypothetical protein